MRVVITGIGALAPNGNSAEQFWSAIESGTSGIAPITYFDASNHRVSIAGELKDFNPEDTLDLKEIRKLDPFSTFALVCSNEAIQSANLDLESIDLDKSEYGLSITLHGHQAFGPASNAKVSLESRRLTKTLKSIKKVGYDISHGLPRGYFLIDTNGSWVFHVVGGKHRMAALIYLGWKNIPCQLEPSFPRTVYLERIDEWPGVRNKDFSEEDAREIFYSYFRNPNCELINE